MRPALVLLALAVCGARAGAQTPDNLQLFLLTGQSNMAGRGAVEPRDREPLPRVWSLNKDLAWVPATDPLHFDKPIAGVSLGRSFGRALARVNRTANIGLIPCAVGGTSLDEWKPDGKLYANAVARARAAMKSGTLRGILWHQGEAESGQEERARSYRDRFREFIGALRSELGAPDVPVIVGQLGEFLATRQSGSNPFAGVVNEQLAMVPLAVRRAAFVSSAGLGHKGDEVHFDAPALRELGRRYALAYLSLDPTWAPLD